MNEFTKIDHIGKLDDPKFVKPVKIEYIYKNQKRVWEAVESHNSVSIILYNIDKDALVVVKQMRIPVLNMNKKDGVTYELCAGIIDKNMSKAQIVKEEVYEECGYDLPLGSIQKITSFYTSVGISGAQQTLFYAKCNDSMRVNNGGGMSDEDIEVLHIPLNKAKDFMFDLSYQKTPGLIMGFYWFFDNIKQP